MARLARVVVLLALVCAAVMLTAAAPAWSMSVRRVAVGSRPGSYTEIRANTVEAACAAGDPQALFDSNPSTVWTAAGTGGDSASITFDLSEVKSVSSIALAFPNVDSQERPLVYRFDVSISEDGSNWTTPVSNQSTEGIGPGLNNFALGGTRARYVRFTGRGNQIDLTNNLSEARIEASAVLPACFPSFFTLSDRYKVAVLYHEAVHLGQMRAAFDPSFSCGSYEKREMELRAYREEYEHRDMLGISEEPPVLSADPSADWQHWMYVDKLGRVR